MERLQIDHVDGSQNRLDVIIVSEFCFELFPKRISRTEGILAECYFFERESWLSLPAASRLEEESLASLVRISYDGEAIFFCQQIEPLSWTVSLGDLSARRFPVTDRLKARHQRSAN